MNYWNLYSAIIAGFPGKEVQEVVNFIKDRNLHYTIELQLVKSIVAYARSNANEVDEQDLVDALNFFLENDAYFEPE